MAYAGLHREIFPGTFTPDDGGPIVGLEFLDVEIRTDYWFSPRLAPKGLTDEESVGWFRAEMRRSEREKMRAGHAVYFRFARPPKRGVRGKPGRFTMTDRRDAAAPMQVIWRGTARGRGRGHKGLVCTVRSDDLAYLALPPLPKRIPVQP